jgi:hypothetical protein
MGKIASPQHNGKVEKEKNFFGFFISPACKRLVDSLL